MKACYIVSGPGSFSSAGAAWAEALHCEVMTFETFTADYWEDCPYGLLVMDISPSSFEEARVLTRILRERASSQLVFMITASLPEDLSAIKAWHDVLSRALLLVAHDAHIVHDVMKKTGLNSYELYPPFDAGRLQAAFTSSRKDTFTVVVSGDYRLKNLIAEIGWPLFLFTWLRYTIRIVPTDNKPLVTEAISTSALVYVPRPLNDGGYVAAGCALAGAILVANRAYGPGKVSYPYTMFDVRHRRRAILLLWIYSSGSFRRFFIENARYSLVNFNKANKRDQLTNLIRYKIPGFRLKKSHDEMPGLKDQIVHYSGKRHISYDKNECVLVCLLRNGEEYIPSFLSHYRALGVRHFFFIDNGSGDNTLDLLRPHEDVTIYRTSLPHKYYENEIRRLVIEEHCRNRWCLNVDIDELFDYPFSDRLPMDSLLKYLQGRRYTAMAGYMLDMYNRDNTFDAAAEQDLKKAYPCYDISNIEKKEYHAFDVIAYCDRNQVASPDIRCYFGGIRKTVFASKTAGHYLLTKHPLIFLDGKLEPVTNPHYSNNARVADISCVLYHYKFTPSFRDRVIESKKSGRYIKFAQNQYDQYYKKISGKTSMSIDTPGTKKLGNVNELVANGFLTVSPAYRNYAEAYAMEHIAAADL